MSLVDCFFGVTFIIKFLDDISSKVPYVTYIATVFENLHLTFDNCVDIIRKANYLGLIDRSNLPQQNINGVETLFNEYIDHNFNKFNDKVFARRGYDYNKYVKALSVVLMYGMVLNWDTFFEDRELKRGQDDALVKSILFCRNVRKLMDTPPYANSIITNSLFSRSMDATSRYKINIDGLPFIGLTDVVGDNWKSLVPSTRDINEFYRATSGTSK